MEMIWRIIKWLIFLSILSGISNNNTELKDSVTYLRSQIAQLQEQAQATDSQIRQLQYQLRQ